MDPDECLKQLLAAVKKVEDEGASLYLCLELIEGLRNLDEWMSKGGFAPKRWAR